MYTNVSTWSYLEKKSSHLLHKHKQAVINRLSSQLLSLLAHHLLSCVHHQLFSSTRNGMRTNTSFPKYREFSLLRGTDDITDYEYIEPIFRPWSVRRIWELQNARSLCKIGGFYFILP